MVKASPGSSWFVSILRGNKAVVIPSFDKCNISVDFRTVAFKLNHPHFLQFNCFKVTSLVLAVSFNCFHLMCKIIPSKLAAGALSLIASRGREASSSPCWRSEGPLRGPAAPGSGPSGAFAGDPFCRNNTRNQRLFNISA